MADGAQVMDAATGEITHGGAGTSGADSGQAPFDEDSLAPGGPNEGAGGEKPAAGAKAAAPVAQGDAAAPVPLDPEVAGHLKAAGLRPVADETTEAALRRLSRHWSGRAIRTDTELSSLRREQRAQLDAIRESVEPLLRAEYQRQQAAARDQALSEMPEQGTPEHQEWLLHQLLQRDLARETRDQEQARLAHEQAQRDAAEHAQLDTDEAILAELDAATQQDEETASAYSFLTQVALRHVARQWPDSTPAQRAQVVAEAQQTDLRLARARGADIGEMLREAAADARELILASSGPQPAANGNGAAAPAPPVAAPPAQAPASRTAARVQAASSQAAARAVVSPAGRGAAAPSGQGIDLRAIADEDEYVEMRLKGIITDAMQASQFSKPRTSSR